MYIVHDDIKCDFAIQEAERWTVHRLLRDAWFNVPTVNMTTETTILVM